MRKYSNVIVIGGSIAAGKSSLVGALPFKPVQELDPNDELQKVLLEKMYEGDPIAKQVFQLDMMLSRFDKYKNASKTNEWHVFDRMIFEDKLFAQMLFGDVKNIWEYYESIWEDKVEEIINEIGVPKLYILLDIDWPNFRERIFARNRKAEIDNFEANEEYFKTLLSKYKDFMLEQFSRYEIPHLVVNTNEMTKLEVIDFVKSELRERGIL